VEAQVCIILCRFTIIYISYLRSKVGRYALKPSLDLILHVLDGPVRVRLLAKDLLGLRECEAFGLGGRVVTQLVDLADLLVGHGSGSLTICALVNGNDDGTTETQVVLQAALRVFDQTVIGPSTQMPCQFGALSKAGCTY